MAKVKTAEDYEDLIKSLQRKQMELIIESEKLAKQMAEASEDYYKLSPDYVKVTCLFCGGQGFIKNDEGNKVKCNVCNLSGFIWAKKYNEVIK